MQTVILFNLAKNKLCIVTTEPKPYNLSLNLSAIDEQVEELGQELLKALKLKKEELIWVVQTETLLVCVVKRDIFKVLKTLEKIVERRKWLTWIDFVNLTNSELYQTF